VGWRGTLKNPFQPLLPNTLYLKSISLLERNAKRALQSPHKPLSRDCLSANSLSFFPLPCSSLPVVSTLRMMRPQRCRLPSYDITRVRAGLSNGKL